MNEHTVWWMTPRAVRRVAVLLAMSVAAASAVPALASTAMSANPCAGVSNAGPGAAFMHMLLQPGAHFQLPAQTAQQKALAARSAEQARARDWADLCRYRAANAALHNRPRVVLMGDSITDFWQLGDPQLFTHGVLDRGISGQTSAQMLVRFWPDVIALRPRIVQILAGTNDIAGNTGPTSERQYEEDIEAMVTLARAHHIHVILGSMPPAKRFWWAPEYRPAAEIRRLNAWLQRYARAQHLRFVDYYAHLVSPNGSFRHSLSNDGVHPNRKGYRVLSALARRAFDAPWPHAPIQNARR